MSCKREYVVVWVSPTTGKELIRDGAFFDDDHKADDKAVKWAKKLGERRERFDEHPRSGLCKGRLYEVESGKTSWREVAHIGGGS
jgi:hypothetical protein